MEGYTVYSVEKHFAFVQIERGRDDINMTGLEIGFSFDGDTKTYLTMEAPGAGAKYTYKFNFTNDSILGQPDKVTVAPIFILNNQIKLGKILDEEDMPVGVVHLTDEEWDRANEEAKDNKLKKPTYYFDGDGDGYYGEGADSKEFVRGEEDDDYVLAGGDCVVDDGDVSPGADEVMNSGVDEDCDGWMGIDECGVLDVENGNYLLDGYLSVRTSEMVDMPGIFGASDFFCFYINEDNVTLDLNGKTVSGFWEKDEWGINIPSGNGIGVNGSSNILVRNGNIFDFFYGFLLLCSDDNVFEDITVDSNGGGFYIEGSSENLFNRLDVSNQRESGPGFYLESSSADNCEREFMFVAKPSSDNIISESTISYNYDGVSTRGSKDTQILNNDIIYNRRDGVHGRGAGTIVRGNVIDHNLDDGIDNEENGMVIEGNDVCDNTGFAIDCWSSFSTTGSGNKCDQSSVREYFGLCADICSESCP